MKILVDVPEKALEEAMRHAGAKTKLEAVVIAIDAYNRRHRLSKLAGELRSFEGFATREELLGLRVEATKSPEGR